MQQQQQQQREERRGARMAGRTKAFLILATVNVLSTITGTSLAAPYDPDLEMKAWVENAPTPVISQACSAGERCWEWLPAVPIVRENEAYLLQEESPGNARYQTQRQIHQEEDSGQEQWREESPVLLASARSPSPIVRQISPRTVKKDVFMSRSWGPGGLPFSVLYMNPHSARGNHPNGGMAEVVPPRATPKPPSGRSSEGPAPTLPPSKHPNYRVALRNGASGQPRRQYSIIPQLFISYGWGPLGK